MQNLFVIMYKLYKDENKALETIGEPGIGDTYISDNKLYSITTDDSEDFPDDGYLNCCLSTRKIL